MHEERKSRWSWFKSETSEADTGRDEHGNETSSPHEPVERPAAESVDREPEASRVKTQPRR